MRDRLPLDLLEHGNEGDGDVCEHEDGEGEEVLNLVAWIWFHSVMVVSVPNTSMTTAKLRKQPARERTEVTMVARASA